MRRSPGNDYPDSDEPKRNRHGDRGLPPPAEFDIAALPGSALLNEREAASILRLSTNTLAAWRSQPAHPLRWLKLPNGFIRYQVSALRAYLAMGAPRKRKPSPAPAATTTGEIHTTAPPPRRARRTKAEGLPAPQEPAQ